MNTLFFFLFSLLHSYVCPFPSVPPLFPPFFFPLSPYFSHSSRPVGGGTRTCAKRSGAAEHPRGSGAGAGARCPLPSTRPRRRMSHARTCAPTIGPCSRCRETGCGAGRQSITCCATPCLCWCHPKRLVARAGRRGGSWG
jgi:hypothetical protein